MKHLGICFFYIGIKGNDLIKIYIYRNVNKKYKYVYFYTNHGWKVVGDGANCKTNH